MDNRKFLAVLIIAVVVITGACAAAFPGHVDKSFAIVHTNDTHCHYDDEGSAGFTTVASLRDELSGDMPVFTVDAGDLMQGNAYGTVTKGLASVRIANSVGYDLGIPGNHEFDFGIDTVIQRAAQLNYPVICSNLVDKDTGKPVFEEYKILKKGNVRVGFFGLLTDETVASVKEGNLGNAVITDQVEAAQRMVAFLKSQNVDSIVAVGHLGVEKTGYTTSDLVCQRVPGIDIFIDGHSHTEMEDGKVCDGSIVLLPHEGTIASTGCYAKNVGIVKSLPDGISAKLYRGPAIHDARVDGTIADVKAEVEEKLGEVIGGTEVLLNGNKQDVRSAETNLGDLFTDQLAHVNGQDIAFANAGQIRASVQPGDITLHTVYDVLPYDNSSATLDVPGSVVWEVMEKSLTCTGKGQFLQFSGMTVTYDPQGAEGSKVVSILVNGKPIDTGATYTVATLDFIQEGGDEYKMLAEYEHHIQDSSQDVLAKYITEISPITDSDIPGGRLIAQRGGVPPPSGPSSSPTAR